MASNPPLWGQEKGPEGPFSSAAVVGVASVVGLRSIILLRCQPTDDGGTHTRRRSSAVIGPPITIAIAVAVRTGGIGTAIRTRRAVGMGGVARVITAFSGASLHFGGHDRAHGQEGGQTE